ncbi:MAG: MFS transporter, partial [Paramuribaculum sp.]|nr:MFS transporter [Paramuribaculum sp.]
IRVFGTIGFIVAMLFVNFANIGGVQFQTTYWQLFTSGILSFIMAGYALTMPVCPTSSSDNKKSVSDILGLKAFTLFKQKKMAIFFIFSMFLGVSLQITNSYGNTFISAFGDLADFADSFGAKNANALISLSQMSEALCILLIPFCLKRFGIKGVMLMSMFAWVLRFGLLGAGDPGSGIWMFVLSMIVYGIAFDFFNVSGSLYIDSNAAPSQRSSAQGMFMLMTNGVGATIGTLAAQTIVNANVFSQTTAVAQLDGWRTSWFIFAGYALVVGLLFMVLFPKQNNAATTVPNPGDSDPEGMVMENKSAK